MVFKNKFKLIAVLEHPNFIINIGQVIRNINGLGIDELLVVDGKNRLETTIEAIRERKSILKHSNGAVKWTSVKVFDTTHKCSEYLQSLKIISYATSPHNINKNQVILQKSNLAIPKLAIWFGSESKGLSQEALAICKLCITLPMKGKVESLNLSTTTGIVLYEAIRQREQLA